jgi:galactonate dehydratase
MSTDSYPNNERVPISGAVLGGSSMKISRIVDLHADAGWRVFSFLKIETDAGLIGWSEYNESYGSKGVTVVIMKLAETLIGQDPRPVELITATSMRARARPAQNATRRQAGQCAGRGWAVP